jgi:hypothetical protein
MNNAKYQVLRHTNVLIRQAVQDTELFIRITYLLIHQPEHQFQFAPFKFDLSSFYWILRTTRAINRHYNTSLKRKASKI